MRMSSSPTTAPLELDPRAAARTSALGTTIRYEWRLLRSDRGWWTSVLLLLACLGYALANGRARMDERARSVAAAQRDEAQRLNALTTLLGRIERGEVKPPDAPYRDPRNAICMGRGRAAAVAYLPDAPLTIAAVGVSDLYPHAFNVSAGSKDSFLFADEIANPAHLLCGSFDLAFVIVYLYPLLLLAVSYNVLSSEHEQGTLALTLASSARLTTVLTGKLAVRAGALIAAAVAGCGIILPAMGARVGTGVGMMALSLLSLVTVVYGLFWVALALFVNSLKRDSAFNAVVLIMVWVVLLLVAPAAMNAVAQVLYPAPPRAEMVLAVRNAAIDAERDLEATEARYRDEHPDSPQPRSTASPRVISDQSTRRTLAVTLAADGRADAVLANQEARVRDQRRVCDWLSFLVPAALVNNAIAELAGNGYARWDDYLARVGAFHRVWQSFFVERARLGTALTTADYKRFPRFDGSDAGSRWFLTCAGRVVVVIAWIALLAAALWIGADRRLCPRTAIAWRLFS